MSPALLSVEAAAAALRQGGIIAYPTEGVYGLGCDPQNPQALARLLTLKERAPSKGLILIAGALAQLEPYIAAIPPKAWAQVQATWPGAFTWIFPAKAGVPADLCGGRSTIAVRLCAHAPVVALCAAFGGAVVSTSANRSGEPPVSDIAQLCAWEGLAGVMAGPLGGLDRPTPIRDACTGESYRT